MPPRKSNVSTTSNGAEDGAETTPARSTKDGTSVDDLSLPKSMIGRLAKGVLPANTQIQKDALLALHKSATVFVNFIASNANENAQASGKKTIMPPDVVAALKDAEFEDFLPRLEAELKKYNDVQCDKRNTYRRKVKEDKKVEEPIKGDGTEAPKDAETAEVTNGVNGHAQADDAERPAKKLKADAGHAVPTDGDGLRDADMEDEGDAEEVVDGDGEEADESDEAEEDGEDDEEGQDETMEEPVDEVEDRRESRDEALDEPDSD
ncbi:hypothetical protein LTR08_005932 [Meristemomyces frigidus]|nr:hypothetical protein LTR08_005932 [Meristemomyces frigidus]